MNIFKVIFLLFGLFLFTFAMDDDAYYCKMVEEWYRICRRCSTAEELCPDEPDVCQCENIEAYNSLTEEYYGGSDCEKNDFCYVSYETSNCPDEDFDEKVFDTRNYWHHGHIVRSKHACKANFTINMDYTDTGNEEYLPGYKLITDHLVIANTSEKIIINLETAEDCLDQCRARPGNCGAWSYDVENSQCYIHNVESCCDQKSKTEISENFISGYACPHCWSTRNECPCPIKDRQKGKDGISHTSGGSKLIQSSPTGLLEVNDEIGTYVKRKPCGCKWRQRQGRWKCEVPRKKRCHRQRKN